MIRYFTSLCKAILDKLTDEQIYYESMGMFNYYDEKCPNCNAPGAFTPFGDYVRSLISRKNNEIVWRLIRPLRFKCSSCHTTHALLPDILTPYSPYSLRFKLLALTAYFKRETTVVKICEQFGIAVSTIYEWKKRFLSHKELFLGLLASAREPELLFLSGLFASGCLSTRLCNFFKKYTYSFMQKVPRQTSQPQPP
jgi:transposase-like protein